MTENTNFFLVGPGLVGLLVGPCVGVTVALPVLPVGDGSEVAVPSPGLDDSLGRADSEPDGVDVSVAVDLAVGLEVAGEDEKTFGAEQPATTTEPTTVTAAQASRIALGEVLMRRR